MDEFENTRALVERVLRENPETRDSDIILYLYICKELNPIAYNMKFWEVLKNYESLGLPNPNSVSRSRRIVQARCIDLGPTKKAKEGRDVKKAKIEAYVKSH